MQLKYQKVRTLNTSDQKGYTGYFLSDKNDFLIIPNSFCPNEFQSQT